MTYDHIGKPTVDPQTGITDFLICIFDEFLSIKKPVAPFNNPGDSQKITETHTFNDPFGFYRAYQVKDKHEGKGDTAGTFGSKTLKNEMTVFVPGLDEIRL